MRFTLHSMIVSKFNKLPLKWRWAITFLASFSLSLTLCAISYGIYLGIMGTTHEDQPSTKPGNDNSTTERPDGGSGHLKIVSRTQWNAQPAMNVTPLTLPSKYIIIAHTGGNPCSSLVCCLFISNQFSIMCYLYILSVIQIQIDLNICKFYAAKLQSKG